VPTLFTLLVSRQGMTDFGGDMDDERTTATIGFDHYFGGNFDLYTAVMHDEIDSFDFIRSLSTTVF
jgi:hypothetical protein